MTSINDFVEKEMGTTIPGDETAELENEQVDPTQSNSKFMDILMASSPDKHISEYINHPLNFKESRGLAKIIRGFEGMFGEMNKAIFDIVFGGIEFSQEIKKGGVDNGND